MLLLGIDIGTSSIKVSIVDGHTQQCIISVQYPDEETPIISPKHGWAEQLPDDWWANTQQAILKANNSKAYNPKNIGAIGIGYQMHGLVLVDDKQQAIRNSIIWCDSRAVETGDKAFAAIGEQQCLSCLLNSPGNFTASKLAWVKENEPEVYKKIDKMMLPGDYIAMKLTDEITTTRSALSEGIFWDFKKNALSEDIMKHYGLEKFHIPEIKDVFAIHGKVSGHVANVLSLTPGIPVTYKAGDQLNNALSLNVMQPGEVAATAGTSGVIYAVSDQLVYDRQSRINSFAHVNHTASQTRIGVLLCINGTGILNRWLKEKIGSEKRYNELNNMAAAVAPGSEDLLILPFGNGAERMLNNKIIDAHINKIDLNKHTAAHLYRAGQEGIAFAFRYGLDILRENNLQPAVIRAGKANMFLSNVFTEALVNAINVPVELYQSDGSAGAAIGAGIGAGLYATAKEAFTNFKRLQFIEPKNAAIYNDLYHTWKNELLKHLNN